MHPLKLDIDVYLSSVNPDLLKFLHCSTLSAKEKQSADNAEYSKTSVHIKKLRIFYILQLLMYCTNPRKPSAIHNLLADVVEASGGS